MSNVVEQLDRSISHGLSGVIKELPEFCTVHGNVNLRE